MARIAEKVEDKTILKLIRKYLQSGVMINGVVMDTGEGAPQGGPLSPLIIKHRSRRTRQGTRKSRTQIRPLCGRL